MNETEFQQEAARLRPRLVAMARGYLDDGQDAEDTAQDVLMRLWQMTGDLRRPIDPLALALTRNLCIDRLRRRRLKTGSIDGRPSDNYQQTPPDSHEAVERMLSIIDTLPSTQQTILRLRHIEGMDMSRLAQLMNTNETALRKALSRARMAVKDEYLKRLRHEG